MVARREADPSRRRLREISTAVEFCSEARLRRYYVEVYGAEAGDQIPVERLRESIFEACSELLGG